MSSLLAHIKIVEGQEEKFEELSKELYKKSHANEDCIIRYDHHIIRVLCGYTNRRSVSGGSCKGKVVVAHYHAISRVVIGINQDFAIYYYVIGYTYIIDIIV